MMSARMKKYTEQAEQAFARISALMAQSERKRTEKQLEQRIDETSGSHTKSAGELIVR